jgi:autotransporter-associated beta strand protein
MNYPRLLVLGLLSGAVLLSSPAGRAGDATWNLNPISGDWNTAANWTPSKVPHGQPGTAIFRASNNPTISLSQSLSIGRILFRPGASAFSITLEPRIALTINGSGVINNSGADQNFVIPSTSSITFGQSALAGKANYAVDGFIYFLGSSSADRSAITVNEGGSAMFYQTTTAGQSTLTVNGGTSPSNSGGEAFFFNTASAGEATLIANGGLNGGEGGRLKFLDMSDGGIAQIKLFGNGVLDLGSSTPRPVIFGSVEGDGVIDLVSFNELITGANNLDTEFSGLVEGAGSSLTKVGTGTFTLSGANTYTAGTTVQGGTLVLTNQTGSATGDSTVLVNSGMLGGSGTIAGSVLVGNGIDASGIIAPGEALGSTTTLTIQGFLRFQPLGNYSCRFDTRTATADQIVANGVVISVDSGVQFQLVTVGNRTIPAGTVFTVINNTDVGPITGTFSNLPGGAIVNANGNNLQASYEGGDGNDLTLTAVP